jgi:hypothetical protein
MKRVAALERTRERLRALMDGRLGTAPDRSNLVLLAAQLIVEEALEAEVRDEVGGRRELPHPTVRAHIAQYPRGSSGNASPPRPWPEPCRGASPRPVSGEVVTAARLPDGRAELFQGSIRDGRPLALVSLERVKRARGSARPDPGA